MEFMTRVIKPKMDALIGVSRKMAMLNDDGDGSINAAE